MKHRIIILLILVLSTPSNAHNFDFALVPLHHWTITQEHKSIEGSFCFYNNGLVAIEDAQHNIVKYPLKALSVNDQTYVQKKLNTIQKINKPHTSKNSRRIAILMLLIILGLIYAKWSSKANSYYVKPILTFGIACTLFSFTTDPNFIQSAVAPFIPQVHTYYDSNYFYIESKGIPTTHPMMAGISSNGWQQQVPIPQCYIGNNAWPIPLNPKIATSPIPVDSVHFTRGAIAIAVNGVPIFNVHTNTGVDSYIDGQLDSYGGHCGRADDYHYHIAPLHLYAYTANTQPIAFGLDGYAVYGSVEPDGSPMTALDANHGHFGAKGVYHYHGTTSAPYMIANMVGQVTEDATHQLIPQAAASPVRPGLTPLKGALISSCTPNATSNGYKLIYTLSGFTDSVLYDWTTTGNYNFKFYTKGLLDSSKTYKGFIQCNVAPTSVKESIKNNINFLIYPNPGKEYIFIKLENPTVENEVCTISIFNLMGQLCYYNNHFQERIDTKNFPQGLYSIKLQMGAQIVIKNFLLL